MLNNFKDRLINIRLKKDEKLTATGFLIIGLVILILAANIIYLNFVFLKNNVLVNNARNNTNSTVSTIISPTINPIDSTITSTTQVSNPILNNTQAAIKDYYIPLGSGTSQAGDWEDVAGALATIDFGQYQGIKEIRLEASILVPTGNEIVWVRLFNKTDQHPVWYSEVTANTANSYLISSPMVYDLGQKTYQVQMKTQLKIPANLTFARIHVVSR